VPAPQSTDRRVKEYANGKISVETIERLEKQSRLLLRTYRAELAKDPASSAAQSSRSNMIALRHSIIYIYGEAAAAQVTGIMACTLDL
jgi:hypothetical protein